MKHKQRRTFDCKFLVVQARSIRFHNNFGPVFRWFRATFKIVPNLLHTNSMRKCVRPILI